jgi:hypothetical protein
LSDKSYNFGLDFMNVRADRLALSGQPVASGDGIKTQI